MHKLTRLERELLEALETATRRLERCAALAGNAPFAVVALTKPFHALIAKARNPK